MHHYPFHVGDYTLATLHLEDRHDLCYRRLLDAYYLDNGPLADAKQTLSRRIRTDEQTLTEVLTEFFVLVDGYWHHSRCDIEIARFKAKSEKAKIAGSQGGKAKSSERKANAKRTLSERKANQNQNQNQNHSIIPPALPSDGGDHQKPNGEAETGKHVSKENATAKPDERHAGFIRAYADAYEAEAGTKYLFQTRDAKTLQKFLQASPATIEQMLTLLRWAWSKAKQPFARSHHTAGTIHEFLTHWRTLAMERQQESGRSNAKGRSFDPASLTTGKTAEQIGTF
jgi:uncharacterized protein YdaU (DUF1376 family)